MLMTGLMGSGIAQDTGDKIGFVSLEAVMSLMPEYNAMLKEVQTYEKMLSGRLQKKQSYLETKIQDYVDDKESGATEEQLKAREADIKKLDEEIKNDTNVAEQKLGRKRVELLSPITTKLQGTIETIAKAKGYTYVINSLDGEGVSIVLSGPDDNDLTKDLLDALNIDYPKN